MRVYLVGGALRDIALGRPVEEYDYAYFGDTSEFLRVFPNAQPVGRDFPIFIVKGREFAPGRGPDIESDLLARDLTINALALELTPGPDIGRRFAHPRALADLLGRVLRPASPRSLEEDPVRVFRAARFAATLPDFSASQELLDAMRVAADSGSLANQTAERVAGELLKALRAPAPERFVELLAAAGCLTPWFVELEGADAVPAGPPAYHEGSALAHTLTVMRRCSGSPLRAYMALCHDLGKVATPPELLPHHYKHEQRGEKLAERLGKRLKLPQRYIKAGRLAARLHMKAGCYEQLRPGTRVDLLMELHVARLLEEMLDLVRADKGLGFHEQARAELALILAVKLPEELQDLGEESGRRLRELRCAALGLK
jgi:tRNA nucleotidyltransferase (CCA-adding enzyme)